MAKVNFSGVVTIFLASTACYVLESAPTEHETAVITGEQQAARIQAQGRRIVDVTDLGLEETFVAHVQPESGGQP